MLDFLIGEYRGEVIKRHTRKATSYLNSVALETSFIIYNTYFYTSIPYPFPFKVILYPKENVSFFLDDLNDWIRPWLFLSRGSSIMWSQSLIPIGPWVAYLALIVLPSHFNNNVLFMLKHIWGFFVYLIWQSILTSSAYILCVPFVHKCTSWRHNNSKDIKIIVLKLHFR
jgi:hypothetical protein